jgi:hypothetical protein
MKGISDLIVLQLVTSMVKPESGECPDATVSNSIQNLMKATTWVKDSRRLQLGWHMNLVSTIDNRHIFELTISIGHVMGL